MRCCKQPCSKSFAAPATAGQATTDEEALSTPAVLNSGVATERLSHPFKERGKPVTKQRTKQCAKRGGEEQRNVHAARL